MLSCSVALLRTYSRQRDEIKHKPNQTIENKNKQCETNISHVK